jgi:hypothetical protein
MISGLKAIPAFNGAGSSGSGAGVSLTLTFVTSGTSATHTVLIPAAAEAGDIAVVFDGAFNKGTGSITSVTPSGWSTAVDASSGFGGTDDARMKVNYKKLVAGDLGTSPAFSNTILDRKVILIFRPSSVINSVVNGSWNTELTVNNPSAQTVTVVGVATPLIVFAFGGVSDSTGPAFTGSPSMNEVVCTGTSWSVNVGYLVYNTSPSDQSIDIGDGGANGLQSGFLRFT